MSDSKYSKYVITERRLDSRDVALPPGIEPASVTDTPSHLKIMSLDDVVLKGSPYCEVVWMWPGGSDVYPETAEPDSHAHDFDETLGFFGTDWNNAYDLGGEVELWIGDEKFMLTKSCLIFIPKGTYHCPLVIHKVERPIFHFSTGPGGAYAQEPADK